MDEECTVCIGSYNKSTRKVIECARCGFKCCQTCARTYLMQSHHDAHCMNCKHPWDRAFIAEHFPSSFLTGEYKKHRSDVLFERERSLFPETMLAIQRDNQVDAVKKQLAELTAQQRSIRIQIFEAQRQLYALTNDREGKKSSNILLRPCAAENCKGYIDNKGQCGICNKTTCLECNIIITDTTVDHECRDDDRLNWEEIHKNTRPCPNCHVRIHKISGCAQMWCPQCHTAFNYVTGSIEMGVIHNPHYYDFMARNPNHVGVRAGGGECNDRLPDVWRISRIKNDIQKNKMMDFHRLLTHVYVVERYKYNGRDPYTLDLRKKYMLDLMDETMFKKRIQEREKKSKKHAEMLRIWDMFYTVGRDIVTGYLLHEDVRSEKYSEIDNLIMYVNESIEKLNHNYQSKLPIIKNFIVE